jgi:hypothetical protein
MRAIPKNLTAVLAVLLATSSVVTAEDANAVQQKLESKYALTTINAEGVVVIPGVTLTLMKDGLTAGATYACANDYKDGHIALAGTSKACVPRKPSRFLPVPVPFTISGGAGAQAIRPFVRGEKLYVTKIEVKDIVAFSLTSDAIKYLTYKAEIRFQSPKGATLDFAQVDQMIAEVFTIGPPDNQQQAGPPPAPQSQSPALPEIAPPPPPPDQAGPPGPPGGTVGTGPVAGTVGATPQTLSIGLTFDQVVAILGQPSTVADLGSKKIYTYRNPNLKITFVDGKVTDVQ